MAIKFSNNASTTLSASLGSAATTATVADGSVFPTLGGSDHCYITLNGSVGTEIVKVTAIVTNTLTIVRAQDGTTAKNFLSGDRAELRLTTAALNDLAQESDDLGDFGVTATSAELNILDGVTSTAAELNILDGVTSTAAELNILDGVTSTAAELNILDGVTSTTAELNILDGVTATTAELNILDGVTSSATELNLLDGITAIKDEDDMASDSATSLSTQ